MSAQDHIPADPGSASESAKQARSRFLSTMSHELRTPIHGILSFAEFGLREWETATPAELRSYFEQIHESGTVLLTLLNDVIDLAKLEAGRLEFASDPVDFAALASAMVDEAISGATEDRVILEPPHAGGAEWVDGDEVRLAQALRHLVAHSRRCARTRVTVRIEQAADGAIDLVLRDDRPALSPNDLSTLFDVHLASSETPSHAGGMDLGLSIAREIFAAHGGRLSAQSDADATEIRARLPRSASGAHPITRAA